MKIKNLFLAGLAIVALSACSDDDKELTPSGSQVKGYISVNIAQQTKTSQTGATEDPSTGTESNISTVKIVLTNAAGLITEVVNATMTTPPTTDAVQVSAGQHYVYALINYDGTPSGNIQEVINVAAAADATSGYKNGSFLMANEFNGGAPTGPKGAVSVTISESQNSTAATAAEATIKVDRVAVKIVDDTDYTASAPAVTELSTATSAFVDGVEITGFVILNVNKQFNLIQDWDANSVLLTPLHADASKNISEQYYYNISAYTTLEKDGNGDIEKIEDISTAADFKMGAANIVYATENRPSYKALSNGEYTSGKGETTGVIYRVVAKKGGTNVGTFFKYGTVLSTNWDDIAALNNTLPSAVTATNYPELRAKGVQVYEDGIMYYSHFIKDVNVNHQINNKNYFGVFRNSSYKLKVNKFSAIGDDVPGGSVNPVDPDPTKPTDPTDPTDPTNPPIDEEEAYIKVTVTINPWILNTINIDF